MNESAGSSVRLSKNSRSPIWRYFEPVSKSNTRCLLCNLEYRNSGNTTNLIDHLKRRHKEDHNKLVDEMKGNQSGTTQNHTRSTIDSATSEIPIAIQNIKFETEGHEVLEMEESNTDLIQSNEINDELEQESIDATHIEDGQIISDAEGAKIIFDTEQDGHDVQLCKIVPLPHARSEVWTYFGFIADQEGQILDRSKVVCRLCSSQFCYSGNTTNFYSHLKSMHSEIQMRSIPSKSSRTSVKRTYSSMNDDPNESDYLNDTTSSMVNNSIPQGDITLADDETIPKRSRSDMIHVNDITQSIVDFIVSDCRPLAIIQGKGFQRMLRLLAPGYSLPDKANMALAVRKKYDKIRKERELGTDCLTSVDY